ncbi:uncharacterized protein METZ01_LOCUS195753, partial [marine metagenome]
GPETVNPIAHRGLKGLKKAVKNTLRDHSDLADTILENFDEDSMDLYSGEINELARLGPPFWPLVKSLVLFKMESIDELDTENICGLAAVFSPGGIDDPIIQKLLLEKAYDSADSTGGFLGLADGLAVGSDESKVLIGKAISAAQHWYDLENILDHKACDKSMWDEIESTYEARIKDEGFAQISNPLDLLKKAFEKNFVDQRYLIFRLKELLTSDNAQSYLDIYKSLKYLPADFDEKDSHFADELRLLLSEYFSKAKAAATSDEEICEFYGFLIDDLEDNELAQSYRDEHAIIIDRHLSEIAEAAACRKINETICQCALIAAVGDGSISNEEVEEVPNVKPFIGMFRDNREAILTLERTSDIEKARELRGVTTLVHDLSLQVVDDLFEIPSYIQEVVEEMKDARPDDDPSTDGLYLLIKLYASKVEDRLDQRITLWAAKEVASIDGLDHREREFLEAFAKEWNLTVAENDRYFEDVVYPVMDDHFEFSGIRTGGVLEGLRDIDKKIAEGAYGSEVPRTLKEHLGVDSFEDLARAFGHEEEQPEVVEETDGDEYPPIFDALFSSEGDWDKVREAAEKGEDVNSV